MKNIYPLDFIKLFGSAKEQQNCQGLDQNPSSSF